MFILEFLIGVSVVLLLSMVMLIVGLFIIKILMLLSPILIVCLLIVFLYWMITGTKDVTLLGKEIIKIIRRRK